MFRNSIFRFQSDDLFHQENMHKENENAPLYLLPKEQRLYSASIWL